MRNIFGGHLTSTNGTYNVYVSLCVFFHSLRDRNRYAYAYNTILLLCAIMSNVCNGSTLFQKAISQYFYGFWQHAFWRRKKLQSNINQESHSRFECVACIVGPGIVCGGGQLCREIYMNVFPARSKRFFLLNHELKCMLAKFKLIKCVRVINRPNKRPIDHSFASSCSMKVKFVLNAMRHGTAWIGSMCVLLCICVS